MRAMRPRVLWISGALLIPAAIVLLVVGPVSASRTAGRPTAVPQASSAFVRASADSAPPPATISRSRFATWGPGSWCWFADPRAVHVVGRYDKTYVGWIAWSGLIMVGAYDHVFGIMEKHAVGRLFHDDHSSPSIFVEPDDRLTVFFSSHNGSKMFYRTTKRPEDISAWGPIRNVPSHLRGGFGFTYPNPIVLPAEGKRLYLFWRGASWSADYATRSAGGNWSAARVLIVSPGNRPYLKVASNGSDTIGLAFTNGHPRNVVTSVFYAAYRRGALWRARGRRIARLPGQTIRPRQADVVYDGQRTGIGSWVWDVSFDEHHRPVIVYATFPSVENHLYWYAKFNGRRWVSHRMTFAGPTISPAGIEEEYSGGMALDHSDPSVIYLSRKVRGWFEIERWVTRDDGRSFRHQTVVRTPGADNVRPVVARGSDGGPMSLLWLHGHYGEYTDYRTYVEFAR